MPWNRRRARLNEIQWQRTNGALSTQLLQLREQLRNKERYASGLEILLRQRNERIDQLTAQVDQLREHSRHTDEPVLSSRNTLALPQPKALDFAGLGLRQRLDKFHRARIFERRDGRLDVIL